MKLSGFTVTKNCLSLDYCIIECIHSMLPLVDEVVVGEMGSTDGTLEALKEWASRDPRIRIIPIQDWTLEKDNRKWFVAALNETRQHLRYPMALQLDADEVLGDDYATHSIVKTAVAKKDAIALNRLNFVKSPYDLIPDGECCGRYVTRVGPSHLWWPSDEPHSRGEIPLLDMAHIEPMATIFHLGFMRHPQAFYKKARVVLGAFFGNYDSRLADSETNGQHPFYQFPWFNRLERYGGYYPDSVKAWLRARGHSV